MIIFIKIMILKTLLSSGYSLVRNIMHENRTKHDLSNFTELFIKKIINYLML